MADTIINQTTGAVMIPEVWSKKMLVSRENNLVAAKIVLRADDEVKDYGDVIHFPEVSDLAATVVSPGTDVTYQANTESEKTITVNKHYETSFLVHDRFSAQTKYRYAEKMAEKAGYALAKQVDTHVLAEYSNANSSVGNGSTAISKANILEGIRVLDDADVPSSDRHFVVDAYGKKQLFNIDDFIKYDSTGKVSPAVSGERQGGNFGEIYGITVHISNNVPVETATPNVIHGLLLHREAIGLAMQKEAKLETQRKAEKLADLYVTQVLYGVGTLRANHMVDFRYSQA